MTDIKILIAAHKPYWMPTDDIYFPIHVGKYGKQDFGLAGDDSGENISSKNPNYCELTGVYWAWKNLDADYIGLAHYRRHFTMHKLSGSSETKKKYVLSRGQLESLLKGADIIVPNRRNYFIESNYSHYVHAHRQEGLDKVCEIIRRRYPACTDACKQVMHRSWAHMFNMFIMKKEYFYQYCAWLFDILSEVEETVDISDYSASEVRIYGYLSELMLDIWLDANRLKYKEIPAMYMEKRSWVVKGSQFIKRKFVSNINLMI
ncbi:DUF4422 domain-containing protein [Ethanoligenens sp.]|uniref:DUF4422 domain-containing protein n=1 Tax=Ethanoligenens sp. TaxID=2099655 RepID=UPI0039EB505F